MAGTFTAIAPTDKGQQNAGPGTRSLKYLEMQTKWPLIDALLGGTQAMRDRRELSLPKWPSEELKMYENRLKRSFLKPFFKDVVSKLGGKPFSKPITIKGEIPEQLKVLERNADGRGTSLHDLGKKVLTDGIAYGPSYIFVDWSAKTPALTKADERKAKSRPVLRHIAHQDLIAAYSRETSEGVELAEARIWEASTERVGYIEEYVYRVREFIKEESGAVILNVWRWSKELGQWGIEEGPITLAVSRIPIEGFFAQDDGFFSSAPPLQSLAEGNEKHWQLQSDQDNNMAFVGVAMLKVLGFTEGEIAQIVFAPGAKIATTRPPTEADVAYLEPSATGITARAEAIRSEEAYLQVLGIQPTIERVAPKTATEIAVGTSESESILQSWVRQLEFMFRRCYDLAAEYAKATLAEDVAIDVFADWNLGAAKSEELTALQAARGAGDLSRQTFLKELQRRGVLADDVDIEAEAELADQEAAASMERELDAMLAMKPPPAQGGKAPPAEAA